MKECKCGYQYFDNDEPDFTVAKGIEIQQEQLSLWERILKPEVFAEVKQLTEHYNNAKSNRCGHDICRGYTIDEIVHGLRKAKV